MKVLIKDIQPAFDNAHKPMWAKHSGGRILDQYEGRTLPSLWWEKEYNVKIHCDKSTWPYKWHMAEFESSEVLTMFLLKWS